MDRISFTGPNGQFVPFYGNFAFNNQIVSLVTERGKKGFDMAPIKHIADEIPNFAGGVLREVRVMARKLEVPLFICCPGHPDVLRQAVRMLASTLNPLTADGIINVTVADGTTRQIAARYDGGFEGDDSDQNAGGTFRRRLLHFTCYEPYFQDVAPQNLAFAVGSPVNFFPWGSASTMIRLSSSTVAGTTFLSNPGDVEAWPVWTITGPGANIVLTDFSQGQTIRLSVTLVAPGSGSPSVITIDTRPGIKTITDDIGRNLWQEGFVDSSSSLFSIAPGSNTISVQMTAAAGTSKVLCQFTPQYWGV